MGLSLFLFVGCSNSDKNVVDKENNLTNAPIIQEEIKINEVEIEEKEEVKENTENEIKKFNKQEYLDNYLTTSLKDKMEGSNFDMKEATSEKYRAWDDMLNEIYKEIMNTLSNGEQQSLVMDESNWIVERDTEANRVAKEVEGGSLEPLLKTSSLVNSTKERCYELVNRYME